MKSVTRCSEVCVRVGGDPLQAVQPGGHPTAMRAIRRRWTAEAVRALTTEDRPWPRYELIRGELLVTPAPAPLHQIAVAEIFAILRAYLERVPSGYAMLSPADLELEPGSINQPDVFVVPALIDVAGDRLQWSDVKSILLAVEVLSPSSSRVDRVEKRDFYCDVGVPEYWIFDLDAEVVERWTPLGETPEILRDELVWSVTTHPPLSVDLARLFDRIATIGRVRRVGRR